MSISKVLDEAFYPKIRDNWDDTLLRDHILVLINQDHMILDLGAGAGVVKAMNFRGLVQRVCGVDPDPRVRNNPFLDEGLVGVGDFIPYADNTFDVVFADNVLEHLATPELVFAEVRRVLRPGGRFVFKTPNKRHYMPLIAKLTPIWFHKLYNRLRGRKVNDTFPTYYKANSPSDICWLANTTDFIVEEIRLIESRPEYLRILGPLYLLGIAYERLVNATEQFRGFRILLIGVLQKPALPATISSTR